MALSRPTPGAREKGDGRTVPRTDTGALAEQAKAWRNIPAEGIRQVGPVCSLEGVPAV